MKVASFRRPSQLPSSGVWRRASRDRSARLPVPPFPEASPAAQRAAGCRARAPPPAPRRSVARGRSLAYLKQLVRLRPPPGALPVAIIAAGALLSSTAAAAPPEGKVEGAL